MGVFSIDSFIEEATRATSSSEVSRLYGNAIKHFGYDRFCYSLITAHPSVCLPAGHAVVSNYPPDWMSHYTANRYEKKDPVPQYGLTARRPYTWDCAVQTRKLRPEQKKVMDEAQDAGLLDGVAVPICGPNGELAGVGMASSVGGIRPDLTVLSKLHTLSQHFHLTYIELERKDRPAENDPIAQISLTDREKEILCWTAEGKSDAVIAEILGISHATIRFHMNNIFRKLNANERTLATAIAIRHGLILPSYVR
jgi:DNA-binding CsgD family transcriptional regulator